VFTLSPQDFGYLPLTLLVLVNQLLIPAPTDLVMFGMIKLGFNLWIILIIALAGMLLGATSSFVLGKYGLQLFPFVRREEHTRGFKHVKKLYQKHGQWLLLFSPLPVIGRYLPTVAGLLDTPVLNFYVLFFFGKLVYYLVIIYFLKSTAIL